MQVEQEAKPHSHLQKRLSTLEEPIPKQSRIEPQLARPQTVTIHTVSESYKATLNRLVFAEQFPQVSDGDWVRVGEFAMTLPVQKVTERPVLGQRPYSINEFTV